MARAYFSRRSNAEIKAERKELKSKIKELKKEKKNIENSLEVILTPEQRERYESWNKAWEENKRGFREMFKPYENEKDYLIKTTINSKISLYGYGLTALICEEKGHNEKVIALGNNGTVCRCDRCGASYTRGMSIDEGRNFYDTMHTPFTI